MKDNKKLVQLIQEHPNAQLMPMIDHDINMNGDFSYRCAAVIDCEYAEITIYEEDGIVYRKSDSSDIEALIESITIYEKFTEAEARERIKKDFNFSPVILLWIEESEMQSNANSTD